MMNTFKIMGVGISLVLISSCSTEQDVSFPSGQNASTSDMKEIIYQKRVDQKRGADPKPQESPLENFSLNLSPGYFIMEWPAIQKMAHDKLNANITLNDLEKSRLGGMFLYGNTLRHQEIYQTYIQVLRQKLYQPCRTFVAAELSNVQASNKLIRKAVPDAQDIDSFMRYIFRANPKQGHYHFGADLYAQEIKRILEETPSQNRTDLFATVCLSIVTDMRMFAR